MLPGFLTTALEVIIILDICGAIAYFTLTGLTRMKDKKETQSASFQNTPAGMPALAPQGMVAALPEPITASVYHPTAEEPSPQAPSQKQWTAGFKQRFSSLTRKFTYRPTSNKQAVKTQPLDNDYTKLGRVLDSFKEDA